MNTHLPKYPPGAPKLGLWLSVDQMYSSGTRVFENQSIKSCETSEYRK